MGKIIGLSVILLILFGLSCFVLILLIQDKTPENYIFLGFLILLFSSIFCVGLLGFKITGSNIGIEKTVEKINTAKKDVSKVTETFIKIAHVLADGTGRYGGVPQEHLDQIKKYQNSLKEYLSSDFDDEIKNTIQEINDAINSRIKRNKK